MLIQRTEGPCTSSTRGSPRGSSSAGRSAWPRERSRRGRLRTPRTVRAGKGADGRSGSLVSTDGTAVRVSNLLIGTTSRSVGRGWLVIGEERTSLTVRRRSAPRGDGSPGCAQVSGTGVHGSCGRPPRCVIGATPSSGGRGGADSSPLPPAWEAVGGSPRRSHGAPSPGGGPPSPGCRRCACRTSDGGRSGSGR